MSNIIKAINFLKSAPDTSFLIISNESNPIIGLEKNYLKDIPNEDLAQFLKRNLSPILHDTLVWVELRRVIGVTDKKQGAFSVLIEAEKPAIPQIQQQHVQPMHNEIQHTNFLGQAVQTQGNNVMISATTLMELQRRADKLDDANEKIAEYRKEVQDIKHERNVLDVENRDLKSKYATAETQKELAVQMAKLENKGFFESESFGKLMEKAPEMLGSIAAMKSGAMPMAESLGAASNLSEKKQEFVEYISESLNDEQVNYLGSICHFLPKPEFKTELHNLILKYNGN